MDPTLETIQSILNDSVALGILFWAWWVERKRVDTLLRYVIRSAGGVAADELEQ